MLLSLPQLLVTGRLINFCVALTRGVIGTGIQGFESQLTLRCQPIGHVIVQSCLLIILQYWPIVLQFS